MASNPDASLETGTPHHVWKLLIDHEPVLRRRCQQLTTNRQDAEDALSELRLRLFTLLLREPQRLEHIENLPAWLRRVASNHCIDRLRSTPSTCSLDWLDLHPADSAGNEPERQACLREAMETLGKALHQLPPNLGDALWQHCVDGMAYGELARHLQIKEPNLRKRVQLARDQLRQQVGGLCQGLQP